MERNDAELIELARRELGKHSGKTARNAAEQFPTEIPILTVNGDPKFDGHGKPLFESSGVTSRTIRKAWQGRIPALLRVGVAARAALEQTK
jgi:hypothetical protein